MNTIISNRLKMYLAIRDVFADHQPVWTAIQAFSDSVAVFNLKTIELNQAIFDQASDTSGVVAGKNSKHAQTAKKTQVVAAALRVYAKHTGDAALREQLRFPVERLRRGNTTAILQLMDMVRQLANTYQQELTANYGLTQQQIAELSVLHADLATAFLKPRGQVVKRMQHTEEIRMLSKELTGMLRDDFDELILVVKDAHPEFYKLYKAARNVVDLKGKKNKKSTAPVIPAMPPAGELPPPAGQVNGSK